MFRDDGYLGPKVVVLLVVAVLAATMLYIISVSRKVAKAGSPPENSRSALIRRIEEADQDLHDPLGWRERKQRRSR